MATERQEAAAELLKRRSARRDFREFMRYCWWLPTPYIEGLHTIGLCERLTRAVDDYLAGQSSYLCFILPFQHGKSTHIGNGFPPYFAGRAAALQPGILGTGYGDELVQGGSNRQRLIVQSDSYRRLFPQIEVNTNARCNASFWSLRGWGREFHYAGLKGSVTGNPAALAYLDDFCKQRAYVELASNREADWISFTNEFKTRWADPCIAVILATHWHDDDIFGRIRKAMKNDPRFPRFEFHVYPARDPDGVHGHGAYEWLWPEYYSPQWYEGNYAALRHDASGLLDCDPRPRSGTLFDTDRIEVVAPVDWPRDLREVRCWDLASTEKELAKNDPDFTAGVRAAVRKDKDGREHLWVTDVAAGQWGTAKRDKKIMEVHARDERHVSWEIEGVGGYKDTFARVRHLLAGRRTVRLMPVATDKFSRITELEATVNDGLCHIKAGPWNDLFMDQYARFPYGHDDVPDATSGSARASRQRGGDRILVSVLEVA